jgi:hypothetical protein
MGNNNYIKKLVIIALTSSLLLYFAFAFVILEANPLKWEKIARFQFVFVFIISKIMDFLIIDFIKSGNTE